MNRGRLDIDVDGRLVQVDGELGRASDGRSYFWLETSRRWRWADGEPMADSERLHLVTAIPKLGAEEGWLFELDEGPWPKRPPITSRFDFKGRNRLTWTSGSTVVVVPGSLSVQAGLAFEMDMTGEWLRPDGARLTPEEVEDMATAIQAAAPANGVAITRSGRLSADVST